MFAAGLVFGVGLGLSGMTLPQRVIGFLDVAGAWDPSLVFVMGSALLVHFVLLRGILARPRPLLDPKFHLPTVKGIDGRLLLGATIFGVGWGLGGYCPGPAIVAVGSGSAAAIAFVAAMAVGMFLEQRVSARPEG